MPGSAVIRDACLRCSARGAACHSACSSYEARDYFADSGTACAFSHAPIMRRCPRDGAGVKAPMLQKAVTKSMPCPVALMFSRLLFAADVLFRQQHSLRSVMRCAVDASAYAYRCHTLRIFFDISRFYSPDARCARCAFLFFPPFLIENIVFFFPELMVYFTSPDASKIDARVEEYAIYMSD